MIAFLVFVSYLLMAMAFCAWDAFIGLPVEFDGRENPPLVLVAAFWPVAAPILVLVSFANFLGRVKEKREYREEQQRKVRVAAQKEMDNYLEEVEKELKRYARKT